MENEQLQQQIDDLQGRLAYQEDLLHSLNEVISRQDKTIQQLEKRLQQQQDRLQDVAFHIETSANDKPPHY